MRQILLAALLLCASVNTGYAQNLFEDADGESSIMVSKKSWLWGRFNSGDDAATIGINRQRDRPGFDVRSKGIFQWYSFFVGGSVKVELTDGIGDFLSKGKVNPGVTPQMRFGVNGEPSQNGPGRQKQSFYSFYLELAAPYKSYELYDTSAMELQEIKRMGFNATLHYNKVWNLGRTVGEGDDETLTHVQYLIMGISGGFNSGANNYDDLDELSVSVPVKTKGGTTIADVNTYKVGSFTDLMQFPASFDLAYVPRILEKNIIGFNTYVRSKFGQGSETNLGVGVFFTNGKSPTNVVGGIAWQLDDAFAAGSGMNNSRVFFYVGYSVLK